MFTAMVLACAIGSVDASTCIEATDERGPYQTREECHSRVQEMVTGIAYMIPVPLNFHFKCEIPETKGIKL